MADDAWPVIARLNPGAVGLGQSIHVFPKYSEMAQWETVPKGLGDVGSLETALVVLNGGETSLMRFSERYDGAVLDDRLMGPDYKISSQISSGDRDVSVKLGAIAGSALAVKAFADHFSGSEFGRVNQAIASAFRELYRQYLDRVAAVSAELAHKGNRERISLYQVFVDLEPFSIHLNNARSLIRRLDTASRQARERKRLDGATDLVERASTSQFVSHDDREATIALRGGAVLRCLGESMHREMGDPVLLNLYEELLQAGSEPYLEMLSLWITQGVLVDPFEEFMIQETKADNPLTHDKGSLDDYWDKRYTVRAMDLPLQSSAPRIYNMLSVCGKYLHVLREIYKSNPVIPGTDEQQQNNHSDLLERSKARMKQCKTIEDPRVLEAIGLTYKYANTESSKLMKSGNPDPEHPQSPRNLRASLKKLNSVFFLQSDLYTRFLDEAKQESRLPVSQVRIDQSERALAQVKDIDDPWSTYISVKLAEEPLSDTLLGVVTREERKSDHGNQQTKHLLGESRKGAKLTTDELMQFDFEVPFPLSLVVSRRSISRYQFLFRHSVELMSVRDLSGQSYVMRPKQVPIQFQWKPDPGLSTGDSAFLSEPRHWWARTGFLRQRQALFIDLLIAQSTQTGIIPEYAHFESQLNDVDEVSELVNAHSRFLDRSLMASLLSDSMLIKYQARLLSLCRQFVRFADQNVEVIQYFTDLRIEPLITNDGGELSREEALGWYAVSVEKHEAAFDRNLQRFKDRSAELIPTNFVAGGSMQLLSRQSEPLKLKAWPKYEA